MTELMKPREVIIVQNGRLRGEVNDCNNALRFNKIFDEDTVQKLLVALAIYNDFDRETRIEGDNFRSIVKGLLISRRSVLAINEKCGGTITATCNGCADGEATSGSYTMGETDVTK